MTEFLKNKNFPRNASKKTNYQVKDKVWYKSGGKLCAGTIIEVNNSSYLLEGKYLNHTGERVLNRKSRINKNESNERIRVRRQTFNEIE